VVGESEFRISLRLGISALNGQALHWDRPPALHRASMEYFLLFVA